MMLKKNKGKKRKGVFFDLNLQIIFGVTLVAVLGVSSITPAFPKMAQELGISSRNIGLLVTVFTLPGIILAPVMGVLADKFGRKKVLIPSLFLFGLSGSICSIIRSFNILLILRFFQGIGAASLGSLNATIIGDLYSGRKRAKAMGYNASVLSVGTATYPAIGGALATMGWFYPFILPLLAIPVGLLVLFKLKNPEPKNNQNIKKYLADILSSIRNIQVMGVYIISILTFTMFYGSYLTYFPFLLEDFFSTSPFIIGILMSSMSISAAVTSSQLGNLAKLKFFPETNLLKMGFFLYGAGLAAIPFIGNICGNMWLLLIPTIIFGIGHGINIPSINLLLAKLSPTEQRAAFMSLNGMALRVGQTLGPMLMGMVLGWLGVESVFYAGSIVCLVGIILIFFTISKK